MFHLCVESSPFLSAKGVLPVPCEVGAGSGGEDLPQSGGGLLHVGQNLQEPSKQGYGLASILPILCEVGAVEARTCLRVGPWEGSPPRGTEPPAAKLTEIQVSRHTYSQEKKRARCEAQKLSKSGGGLLQVGQNLQQHSEQGYKVSHHSAIPLRGKISAGCGG